MKTSLIIFMLFWFGHICFAQTETLVWSDEFNGSGVPDPANWGYDLGNNGWGNQEIQNYTNLPQNARQEGGVLIIEALKQGNTWTSARLLTNNKHEFRYGRIVFRAKLPVGIGTWPALWMLGENFATVGWPACGEIDVMEHVGRDPQWIHSTVHSLSSYGNSVNTQGKQISTCETEFHTYQLNWTYQKLEFSVDSIVFYTYHPAVRNLSTWPFDKPFFLIMNIAMGGTWGSYPPYETGGLKNGIDPSLSFARMEIDYVRVYQYPASVEDPSVDNYKGNFLKSFVSPNPTEGRTQIDIPAGTSARGAVYNVCGKNVFQFIADNPRTEIDLSALPTGFYSIVLQSEGRTSMNKLIIK